MNNAAATVSKSASTNSKPAASDRPKRSKSPGTRIRSARGRITFAASGARTPRQPNRCSRSATVEARAASGADFDALVGAFQAETNCAWAHAVRTVGARFRSCRAPIDGTVHQDMLRT